MDPSSESAVEDAEATPRAPADWARGFTPGRLALLTVLLLFAQYPEVMLGTHSFFDRDFGLFTCPVAHYTRESLWRGEIPLWNPLSNCGVPFLAQWNTSVCYPLSWIYVICPLPWSLNYFCLGHLVLAAVGMYLLAHRWTEDRFAASVAGLAYALNGLTFNCLMWTSNLAALSWLPFTVLAVERAWQEGGRRLAPAAFIGGLQMLSGSPETILLTWLFVGALWLEQVWQGAVPAATSGRRLAATVVLVFGLTAIQLLPFFELLQHSDRGAGQGNETWAMPAWGWANLIVPLFRCSPAILGAYYQLDQQWTSSYYVTLVVLALALVAACKLRTPRVRWLAGAALLGMVLALGEHGFLYGLIKRAVPAFTLSRYPIKFIVASVFAFPLLAAFAMHWVRQAPPANLSPVRRSLFGSGACLLALLLAILAAARWLPYADHSWLVPVPQAQLWPATLRNGMERALFLILILGAIWLQARSPSASQRKWLGLGILILLGLDALTHTARQNPTVTNRAYGPLPLGMSSVPRLGESRAMVSPRMQALLGHAATPDPLDYYVGIRRALSEDSNLLDHLPKVNGFWSLYLREETAVRALLYSRDRFPSGLADFLGVSQISSPDVLFKWITRDTALPWATTGQQPIFADPPSTLTALASAEFNPRRMVYLPIEARAAAGVTNAATAEITASHFTASKIALEVTAAQPAWVVLAQTTFPAWQAWVDNDPAHLWKANYAFQALEVPAGHHTVRLVYRDRAFQVGAALSLVTLAACLMLQLKLLRPAMGAQASPRGFTQTL